MDLEQARALLGLGDSLSQDEVGRAFTARIKATEERMAAAPTDNLRAKYKQAVADLEQAFQTVQAHLRPAAPHLSRTQLGDLPSAQPVYTQSGIPGAGAAAARNLLQPGKLVANRYEIRQRIGEGGMGEVYRAHDRNRNEEIAIKVLLPHLLAHPTARERFLAEAKVASSLSHPNIVNVFDVQREGDNDFITMELLQGQTLRDLMKARKAARQPFSASEVQEIGKAIGTALGYAHKYTVHRDVKPENVWVEEDGSYKLMDFGIARLMSTSQLTATTTAMGTAYYMAPEQLRSAKTVDGRADQYALAVMLYELVSGEVPAGRIKPLHQINRKFPRGASQAIDRALDPQPEDRYADMGAFVKALHARGGAGGDGALKALAGVMAVAALAFGGVMFWPQIKALMPDREAAQLLRGQAIQSQGIIETLLKRVENAERDLDAETRDAKSAVDRAESAVQMQRDERQKAELQAKLHEAQKAYALALEVRDTAAKWVFQSDTLAKVRGQLAVGAAALRDGQVEQAASDLQAAQKTIEDLLQQPNAIRDTVLARGAHDEMLARIETLARDEKKNASTYLGASDSILTEAQQAASEGRFRDAARLYGRAAGETGKALNSMIDELVAAYGVFAQKAMNAKRLQEASTALARAKSLDALKYAGN